MQPKHKYSTSLTHRFVTTRQVEERLFPLFNFPPPDVDLTQDSLFSPPSLPFPQRTMTRNKRRIPQRPSAVLNKIVDVVSSERYIRLISRKEKSDRKGKGNIGNTSSPKRGESGFVHHLLPQKCQKWATTYRPDGFADGKNVLGFVPASTTLAGKHKRGWRLQHPELKAKNIMRYMPKRSCLHCM